jgi:hypothetical protein
MNFRNVYRKIVLTASNLTIFNYKNSLLIVKISINLTYKNDLMKGVVTSCKFFNDFWTFSTKVKNKREIEQTRMDGSKVARFLVKNVENFLSELFSLKTSLVSLLESLNIIFQFFDITWNFLVLNDGSQLRILHLEYN